MREQLLVGAHMSIAGGIHRALELGDRAGCRTIQIFLKNSNQWRGRTLTRQDRSLFCAARERSPIQPILAHASYLINLGSPDKALHRKSLEALVEELNRAVFLGVPALILHPGAHMGSGEAEGIARVSAALNEALKRVPPPVKILLENTAGQGSSLGCSIEQLAAVLDGIRDAGRIGFCLDTCHLFAAGYDIRTAAGYRRTIRHFDRVVGRRRIEAFHVNDSLREFGSRVDRHTHIGRGHIGLEAFRALVNDRRFSRIPKILETPKGKDLEEDIMNLEILRSLVKP